MKIANSLRVLMQSMKFRPAPKGLPTTPGRRVIDPMAARDAYRPPVAEADPFAAAFEDLPPAQRAAARQQSLELQRFYDARPRRPRAAAPMAQKLVAQQQWRAVTGVTLPTLARSESQDSE